MQVKFTKDYKIDIIDIKADEVYEVTSKKDKDKYVNYVRYQIKLPILGGLCITVPEMYVKELYCGRSH